MVTFFVTTVLVLWKAHLSESAWNTDYAHAIKYVRDQDKPLFILFDVARPGDGQEDQSAVLVSDESQKVLESDYIRLFVDLQSESGRELAAEFGVIQYPRVVVIDRSGDWQVYRRSGFHTADQLQSVLERYRRTKLISTPATVSTPATTTLSVPTTSTPLCKT